MQFIRLRSFWNSYPWLKKVFTDTRETIFTQGLVMFSGRCAAPTIEALGLRIAAHWRAALGSVQEVVQVREQHEWVFFGNKVTASVYPEGTRSRRTRIERRLQPQISCSTQAQHRHRQGFIGFTICNILGKGLIPAVSCTDCVAA
jgi:hypothetical protein